MLLTTDVFFIIMVVQAVLVPLTLAGHFARAGITTASLTKAASTFAQSLPFGAGYSLGTYLGFPKNYQNFNRYSYKSQKFTIDKSKNMAYGKSTRFRKWFSFRRTNWYWKPIYHRKLGRTVYTHPTRGR